MEKVAELSEIEKAKQLLKEESENKIKACSEEINAVLEKHGMILNCIGQFSGSQIQTQINLVPKQ